MRVLLVSGIYPPDLGGPATYLPELARELQFHGHEVAFFILSDQAKVERIDNWKIYSVKRNIFLPARIVITIFKIWKISKNFDAILANGLYIESGIILRIFRKKSIAKIVGDPVWERARNKGRTALDVKEFNQCILGYASLIQRLLIRYSLDAFDAIYTPSRELQELVSAWGVATIPIVIYNGIQLAPIILNQKSYDVVSISRLVKWKNLDHLIIACGRLKIKLAIVGSGPDELYLRKVAANYGPYVEFLGEKDSNGVYETLSKSKIFALISQYEGLSFSLLEAMSQGLPVIVSDVQGNTEVVRHRKEGLVINPNNEREIMDAILEILSDETLVNYLGSNARARVSKFYNQKTQFAQVISLLEKVANH